MKKYISILLLLALSVLAIVLYWNTHLHYTAFRAKENEKRIATLEDANKYFPYNDLVYYELGKAFYNLGMMNLHDSELSASLFQRSVSNFKRSLLLNPASQFCHFSLARALFI